MKFTEIQHLLPPEDWEMWVSDFIAYGEACCQMETDGSVRYIPREQYRPEYVPE